MIKKAFSLVLLVLLLILPLFGCWNYRGLNEMVVVAGVAVDKNQGSGYYDLSFEIIDLTKPVQQNGLNAKMIESEGETIFDAVRNAKKRASDKLYFGHTQIVVISEDIARSEDIGDVLDWFLRDGECRETICVVISQEKTAREILSIKGINEAIISSEIKDIIKDDRNVTSSTACVELYQVFGTLQAQGKMLALPAIHNVMNDGELTSEINGIAVYKNERMVGYLTPEESKYYLFITNQIRGGILTFSTYSAQENATLEISQNTTERSFDYKNGQLSILIKTDTTVFLDEYMGYNEALEEGQIAYMQEAAETELARNITAVIQKVCGDFDPDIFGFGDMVYKKNFRLWNCIKDSWDERFRSLDVKVQTEIHIVNTASSKE